MYIVLLEFIRIKKANKTSNIKIVMKFIIIIDISGKIKF